MELSIYNNIAEFDEKYAKYLSHNKRQFDIQYEPSEIFTKPIKILPTTLIFIEIRSNFNQLIDFTYLINLKCLRIINTDFDQSIDLLPDSIQELCFGRSFNQPVNKWPSNLKYLHFLQNPIFNQPLDNLPYGIEELNIESTFGIAKFDQPVNNLPNTLKLLNLGNGFNQPVDNLPESLEQLGFGWYNFDERTVFSKFNQPIDNLPQNLIVLVLGNNFFQSINNLPDELVELFITNTDYNIPVTNLPTQLEKIYISSKDEELESSYLEQINFQDLGIEVIIDTEIEDSLIEFTETNFNYFASKD